MAGSGELYKRKDGKFGFRLKATNGEIVATGQGYATKAAAKQTLDKIMKGAYKGPITEEKPKSAAKKPAAKKPAAKKAVAKKPAAKKPAAKKPAAKKAVAKKPAAKKPAARKPAAKKPAAKKPAAKRSTKK